MKQARSIVGLLLVAALVVGGCAKKPRYGVEQQVMLPGGKEQIWAVAPAVNLSGYSAVDPILQADLLYQQMQQVKGLVLVPVDRVAAVYASLKMERAQSEEQAALVCDLLGCDGLVVPTVTAYDPYNPPKMGGSLQLFRKPASYQRPAMADPRELSRAAAAPQEALPAAPRFAQAVGMFDAANGSVREALFRYAAGRNDPVGPFGAKEYLMSMDRFSGFVYHELLAELLKNAAIGR